MKSSEQQSTLAKEKLNAEEKKFEVGLSTSFNVLEFQEDLAEQQSKAILARQIGTLSEDLKKLQIYP